MTLGSVAVIKLSGSSSPDRRRREIYFLDKDRGLDTLMPFGCLLLKLDNFVKYAKSGMTV